MVKLLLLYLWMKAKMVIFCLLSGRALIISLSSNSVFCTTSCLAWHTATLCGKEGFKVNCQHFSHMILNCGLQQQLAELKYCGFWGIHNCIHGCICPQYCWSQCNCNHNLFVALLARYSWVCWMIIILLLLIDFKIRGFKTIMSWLMTLETWLSNFFV